MQLHVVADVDDCRDVAGRDDAYQPGEHSSGPHAAAQGHQHVASIRAPGRGPFPPPLVPSPPAMPVRIPADQHETVVSVLREAARVNGAVEAYVEPDGEGGRRSLTFAEWDRAADGVAGHLARLGVAKGDVVCLLLPSSIEYAVLYAALLRLGAITSGINPRMGAGEVASILDRAAPVLLVLDPETGLRHDAGTVEVVTRAEARTWWGEEAPDSWPQLASSDPVAVVWTSGTTGQPKGALFDHANLAAVARGTDVLSHPGDRRLSPLPFAHVGYMTRAWDEIGNAVTTVITPTPWRADDAIRVMADEAVTVGQGVPTQWALMLASEELPQADLKHLARGRDGRGAHLGLHGGRDASPLRRARGRALHVDGVVLGHGHDADVVRRGGGDHGGPSGAGSRAGHRRRRRRPRARRFGRPGPPAVRCGHARLLGPRAGPGSLGGGIGGPGGHGGRARSGRVADHRRFRAAHARGQPAAVRPRPRALHPGWLQRVPGRGRGGPLVAPGDRAGRRGRRGRRRPRRGRRRGRRGCAGRAARSRLAARPLRPRAVRLQGTRRAGGGRRAAADAHDEGRPGAPGGAGGSAERRSVGGAWRKVVAPALGC